jgi:DASS family divalent anion:Na+ symporter
MGLAKQYTKSIQLLICFLFGVVLWHINHPEEIDPRGWHLFVVFITSIFTIILRPLPMGAVSILAVTTLITTGTLSFSQAFSQFSTPLIWLVVMAFFIAKAFNITGLGSRIAYLFVWALGRRTLGLAYGLIASDLMLAPVIPSMTARSAGMIYPILLGLSRSYGSLPNDPSSAKMGSFLTLCSFHGTVICSAMFMTAMAGNPLIVQLAADAGIEITWGGWALAAIVPGLLSLLATPLLIYRLSPPELTSTPNAVQIAKDELKKMGKVSSKEWIMIVTLVILLSLWVFGSAIGVSAANAAFIGVSILILTGVLDWEDIITEKGAWNTFVWFATLVMMASFLNTFGLVKWMSDQINLLIGGMDWLVAFPMIALIYFYVHYFFASSTAHISSLYGSLLLVSLSVGTPPM